MIVMQVIREDEAGNLYPEPLPPYPVDPLSTKKDIDTGKVVPEVEQNLARAQERASFEDIVDWEALDVTERSLTFRVLFKDSAIISPEEGIIDTLFVTMNLAQFKSEDGGIYIPDGSQI